MPLQTVEQRGRFNKENPGVPQVTAADKELLCNLDLRLLEEASDAMPIPQRLAFRDVSIGGAWKMGRHAKGDDESLLSQRDGIGNHLAERLRVRHVMISRSKQQ